MIINWRIEQCATVLQCSKQYSAVKRENYIALKANKIKQKRK